MLTALVLALALSFVLAMLTLDSQFSAFRTCMSLRAPMKLHALAASPVIGLLLSFSITPGVQAQCGMRGEGSERVSGIVFDDLNGD